MYRVGQGCTSRPPGRRATKFCTVTPNNSGSSVWNLLHVTLLTAEFCGGSSTSGKICAPLD